jgi:hypothetical protein
MRGAGGAAAGDGRMGRRSRRSVARQSLAYRSADDAGSVTEKAGAGVSGHDLGFWRDS